MDERDLPSQLAKVPPSAKNGSVKLNPEVPHPVEAIRFEVRIIHHHNEPDGKSKGRKAPKRGRTGECKGRPEGAQSL